jgi:TIR domain
VNVFISWSGERSRILAESIRDWLPMVLQSTKVWCSGKDIEKGQQWVSTLIKELNQDSFGVICVSPENRNAPWLLFEAGALSKVLDEPRVCPLLIGMEAIDLPPPLGLFQGTRADRAGIRELLTSINSACVQPLQPSHIDQLFSRMWPELEDGLNVALMASAPAVDAKRETGEMIAEVLEVVRSIERGALPSRAMSQASVMIHDFIEYAGEKVVRLGMDINDVNQQLKKLEDEIAGGNFDGQLSTSRAEAESHRLRVIAAKLEAHSHAQVTVQNSLHRVLALMPRE